MAIMAPRVVPTIDGNPTYTEISLRWIDAVGDLRSDVSMLNAGVTDAQIENAVQLMVSISHASLYTVRVTQVYAGEMSKDNAADLLYLSAQDNIVYHSKDTTRDSRRAFLPSPKQVLFIPGTETPDAGGVNLQNWMAGWDAVWAGTFAGISLRFTQRSEINKKVNL